MIPALILHIIQSTLEAISYIYLRTTCFLAMLGSK